MNQECELCGRWADCDRHHLIGGTANRKNAEKYGLVMYLCRDCHRKAHEDPETYNKLHRRGQLMFMTNQHATTDEFIRVFGKSYL